MTATTASPEAPSGAHAGDDVRARRARGGVLLVGALALYLLFASLGDAPVLARYWFPVTTGVIYLVAAAAGRSRGSLWAPAIMLTVTGLSVALWLRDGNGPDSFQFLALALLSLGLGGVIASLLGQYAHFVVSAMSVSLVVLLLGAFFLAEQQGIAPFAGEIWPFAALLGIWGAAEIARPTRA